MSSIGLDLIIWIRFIVLLIRVQLDVVIISKVLVYLGLVGVMGLILSLSSEDVGFWVTIWQNLKVKCSIHAYHTNY